MSQNRILYGIDLGTTNSAIAYMRRGKPEILKNDVGSDTTPSAVRLGKRLRLGLAARSQWFREQRLSLGVPAEDRSASAFLEFKRNMGTDHVYSPSADSGPRWLAEDLSAEVLKELRRHAAVRDGEEPVAAVITVPSAFKVTQQQATLRAAESAGFKQCHLLQEPVAAAMAFGFDVQRHADQKWLIFDFGGGTFDAALVLLEDGQITVRDTEGDNRLGGKDVDLEVVDQYVLPLAEDQIPVADLSESDLSFLRNYLRGFAERAIIALSSREACFVESDEGEIRLGNGWEIEIELDLNREQLRPAVEPVFQRAIDKAKTLLARYGLVGADLDELVLLGGPTHSAVLRGMVEEQLRPPNFSVDPMTAVAVGAALHASTIPLEQGIVRSFIQSRRERGARILELRVEHESTSINDEEFVTLRYADPADQHEFGPLFVELQRVGWSSGKEALSEEGILCEMPLEKGKANTFLIEVMTPTGHRIETSPSEITIIQGTKLTGSPLNASLGIEVWNQDRSRRVFKSLEGAQKPRTLPVTGTARNLTTTTDIRPGVDSDRLRIRVWEGGSDADGQRIFLFDQAAELELNGLDVDRVIPQGARFDLKMKTADSAVLPARVFVDFPALDEEYEIEVTPQWAEPANWVADEVEDATRHLAELRESGRVNWPALQEVERDLVAAERRFHRAGSDRDAANQAMDRLKEILKALYQMVDEDEWPKLESELDEVWEQVREAEREGGRDDTSEEMRWFSEQLASVKEGRSPHDGKALLEKLRQRLFEAKREDWAREFILWAKAEFDRIDWKDPGRARTELDAAVRAVLAEQSADELVKRAGRVWSLWNRPPGGEMDFDPRHLPQA